MQNAARKTAGPRFTDIQEVIRWLTDLTGVELVDRQKTMIETRLRKRLLDLRLDNFQSYLDYLSENHEQETQVLISLFTTHHTFFFREFMHFQYLENEGIAAAAAQARARGDNTIRIWSTACSQGQEVYSLSLLLAYCLPRIAPDCKYEILGTDIDAKSVAHAQNGVYRFPEVKEIPFRFMGNNFVRGKGDIDNFVKVRKEIKDPCRFETLNLFKCEEEMKGKKFDLIFCRNVYIYFTQTQISSTTKTLLDHLQPTGLLFLGFSESLHGLELPVVTKGNSIYGHPPKATPKPAKIVATKVEKKAGKTVPNPLRVLCVDDSPSILTMLKEILRKERGFEVVATAANGLEAKEKLANHKIDVMTLDIHMPLQSGVEYLKANHKSGHPPVVMISKVATQDSNLALQCFQNGASDYVEKPALANMLQRGDEIRTKLVCAYLAKGETTAPSLALVKSFSQTFAITKPEARVRVILTNLADWKKVKSVFAELEGNQPPTFVFIEGSESILEGFAKDPSSIIAGKKIEAIKQVPTELKVNTVYLADFEKFFSQCRPTIEKKQSSVLVFGKASPGAYLKMQNWPSAQILIEDLNGLESVGLPKLAVAEVVPVTSFGYVSTKFFAEGK